MNETLSIPNFTLGPLRDQPIQYVDRTYHLFGLPEILITSAIFIFLSYWYIMVTKDKEKYTHWTNPNGREVNLYKIIRICFWAYTGIVVIFGIISILLAR